LLGGRPGPHLMPPDPGDDKKHYRTTAKNMLDSLDVILSKLGDENYVFTGKARNNVKPPPTVSLTSPPFLSTVSVRRRELTGTSVPRIEVPRWRGTNTGIGGTAKADYALPPLEDWEFPVDNTFADKVLAQLGPQAMQPRLPVTATFCDRCKALNFWTGGFAIEDKVSDLQESSKKCHFCQMLWGVYWKLGTTKGSKVRFERNESTLRLSGNHTLPVLSIFRSPGKWEPHTQ